MNNFLKGFGIALSIIVVVGCASVLNNNDGIFGKSQKKVETTIQQVQKIDDQKAKLNEEKLTHIASYSKGGVEYALEKIPSTNAPREVVVAKQMNERIEALAGQPDFNELQSIKGIVDDLTSQIASIRQEGENALVKKDKQIVDIQEQYKALDEKRKQEVSVAFAQANEIAKKADQYKATLGQMDSFFGLGAIWYGAHKFLVTSAWVLGIGLILFIILRLLAGANPIASAIFGIFEQTISCVIHAISWIFPKALSLAGQVGSEVYNGTKSALTSIVDSVETVKLQGDASGIQPTIQDLLNTAELSMTPADKALIEKIKLELGWIKPTVVSTVTTIMPTTSSAPFVDIGLPPSQPTTSSFSISSFTGSLPFVVVSTSSSFETTVISQSFVSTPLTGSK